MTSHAQLTARHLPTQTIVPESYLADVRAFGEPELRLRLAVLEEALRDYQHHLFARTPRGRALYADALAWFASGDRSQPYAFERVCDALLLAPATVRACLRRWRTAQLAQPFADGAPTRARGIESHAA